MPSALPIRSHRARSRPLIAFVAIPAPVGRTVRHGELQPFEAELDVLLHVVAGAVSRDSRLGFAAQQLVDRHAERLADQVPQGKVQAGPYGTASFSRLK